MGEIEVITPSQTTIDLDLNNAISFPVYTAPSSPTRIEDYYLSPRQFYRELLIKNSMTSDVRRNSEDDFAFDVSQEMDTPSLSADELFVGGKIRPHPPHFSTESSPRSTAESETRPGREKSESSLSSSRSRHRTTRSLSPMRVSQYPWEEEYRQQQQNHQQNSKPRLASSVSSSSLKGHKKWKLKDFFLFRSASEGRASDKVDPLKKYASLFKKHEDIKSSSFRSIDNSPGTSKRKGRVSAHELHYTMNRAVSEDLKKKTFLPYKQGILGRLAFNPAAHAIANGFGFSRK